MQLCVYLQVVLYVCILYECVCNVYTCLSACVRVYVCTVCMFVCMYVCMYVCMHVCG